MTILDAIRDAKVFGEFFKGETWAARATFVAITSDFASRAKVATEPRSQLTLKTVGGVAFAQIGYANSIRVGKAEALGVAVAVHQGNPFGNRVDGLLGMSFLSRFNVTLSPIGIELTAIPLR